MYDSMIEETQPTKKDMLEDFILDYKSKRGILPKNLVLDRSFIPDECLDKLEIVIDDTPIPIIIVGDLPC